MLLKTNLPKEPRYLRYFVDQACFWDILWTICEQNNKFVILRCSSLADHVKSSATWADKETFYVTLSWRPVRSVGRVGDYYVARRGINPCLRRSNRSFSDDGSHASTLLWQESSYLETLVYPSNMSPYRVMTNHLRFALHSNAKYANTVQYKRLQWTGVLCGIYLKKYCRDPSLASRCNILTKNIHRELVRLTVHMAPDILKYTSNVHALHVYRHFRHLAFSKCLWHAE